MKIADGKRTNIEICQISPEEGKKTKGIIDGILYRAGLMNSTTVSTISCCYPESCGGSSMWRPYVRIFETDDERRRKVVEALKAGNLKMDTEIILMRFIPAEEMVDSTKETAE